MTHMLISLIIIALAIAASSDAETASALRSALAKILSADVSTQQPAHTPTPTPTATATPASVQIPGRVYLDKVIPPCTLVTKPGVDPCELRPRLTPRVIESAVLSTDRYNYRDFLDLSERRVLTTHIVIRGTGMPSTSRCRKEQGIFHSYHIFSGSSFGDPKNYGPQLVCFVDVSVQEYIVGRGDPLLTVAVYHADMEFTPRNLLLARELVRNRENDVDTVENALEMIEDGWGTDRTVEQIMAEEIDELYAGYEWVLYINPSPLMGGEHWKTTASWDVVRRNHLVPHLTLAADEGLGDCETDPCVLQAYHPNLLDLSSLVSETRQHHKSLLGKYDGRVYNSSSAARLLMDTYELTSFFTQVGAYENTSVTPAPPPVPGENDPFQPGTNVGDPPAGNATVTVPGGPDDTATDTPTPMPTSTPEPLPTDTPTPIPTPNPTQIPSPADTPTPIPTSTPAPLPTYTPTAVSAAASTETAYMQSYSCFYPYAGPCRACYAIRNCLYQQ